MVKNLSLLLPVAFICCIIHAENISDADMAARGLIPKPKQIEIGASVKLTPPLITALDNGEDAVARLKSFFRTEFKWQNASSQSKGTSIEIKKDDSLKNNEAYKLEIAENKILITVKNSKGAALAAARLVSYLKSSAAEIESDGRISCAALKLNDYPDIELRGMHLQMAFPWEYSPAVNEEIVMKSIDTASEMCYNFIILEIGGAFKSAACPEAASPKGWTPEQLKRLVKYAKERGITPVPAINAIGHLERAPKIFFIKDDKGKNIAMDVKNPDFYKKYFSIVDELYDIFEKPPFFHIGGDECTDAAAKLAALNGCPASQIYAEFVNKTYEHLEKKNCRAMLWHDMLFNKEQLPEGPVNGNDTFQALDMINKNVIITYWCYGALDNYRAFKILASKGFSTMACPWYSNEGARKFISDGFREGISGVLGTTWAQPYKVGAAFTYPAEYAWNAEFPKVLTCDADEVFNSHYYIRGSKIPVSGAADIKFTGLKDFPSENPGETAVFSGLKFKLDKTYRASETNIITSDNISSLIKNAPVKSYFAIISPSNNSRGLLIDGINKARGQDDVIVYTPAFGKFTNTNPWGDELLVENSAVRKIVYGNGTNSNNSGIPENGCVISVHASGCEGQKWLKENLLENSPVRFAALPASDKPVTASAILPPNTKGFCVLFSSKFIIKNKNSNSLGSITVLKKDRSKDIFKIKNDFLTNYTPPERPNAFFWAAKPDFSGGRGGNEIIAFEWHSTNPDSGSAEQLMIEFSPEAVSSGLAILSGISW